MKSIPFLFILMFLATPLKGFSQDYDSEIDPTIEEEQMLETEIAHASEELLPGEIERQEDIIYPEGEESWALGGEDLPAEEYE